MRLRVAGTTLALAAVSAVTLADSAARTPEQVIRHHFAAAAAADLDAVVSDYADDAVLISANGVARGKQAVRANFAQLLRGAARGARGARTAQAPPPAVRRGPQIVLSRFTHDVAWLIWAQNAGKPNEVRGVETYLILDGKIELETVGTVAVHPANSTLPKQ